jgi:DNA helicase-2/ATP-dependent DNA helicase PcrA
MIDFDFAPSSNGGSKPARKPFTPFADWPADNASRAPISNQIPPFVDQLNDRQREAVLLVDGPLIVLAGAGSGKTKMLTSRIAYLIETKRALPHEILAVTFTNKAAGEMRERVERTLGQNVDGAQAAQGGHWGFRLGVPEIGTFHSVCVRLLRREQGRTPFTKPFVIYDDADQLSLVKAALSKLNIDEKAFSPKGIQAAINRAKCDAIEPHEMEPPPHNLFEKQVKRVYEQYQKDLFANNALDFGEIICMAYRLLRDNVDLREKYQKRFRYLHVDEYQDTNRSQYLLLTMLANPKYGGHGNICVVGDEDQSIYKWRGADIRNILEFEKDYPGAQVVKLEQNYRSTQTIIKAAGHVIKNNSSRKDKTLWTDNEEGVPIVRAQVADERMEADLVVSEIKRLAEADSRPYKDFSIFYRTNAQSRQFEDVLRREKIPYQIVGGLRFYDRKEIKDILSYLKLILNPADSISMKRVINVPARGIGKTTIDRLDQFHTELNQPGRGLEPGETRSAWDALLMLARDPELTSPATARKLGQFAKLINRLVEEQPKLLLSELYHLILDETGYVAELRKEATEESLARIENLEEFDTLLLEFEEDYFSKLPADISEEEKNDRKTELLPLFIEQSALASDADLKDAKGAEDGAPASTVKLMTLHSSKGLEFPVVFLVGMEEGLFPSIKPWEETPEEDIEEERRLCYVGMTRARENLYLLNAVMRRIWGNTNYSDPSRFFAEIPDEYVEFKDLSRSHGGAGRYGGGGSYRQPEYGAARKGFSNDDFNQDSSSRIPASKPGMGSSSLGGKSHLVGQKLNHPEYGPGTILAVEGSGDDAKVTIEFKGRQQRKFLIRYLAAYLGESD